MPINALRGLDAWWYTPPGQEDDEESDRTRFKLKPLDGLLYAQILSEGIVTDDVIRMSGRGVKMCLAAGLLDWENFSDVETGKPLKFSKFNIARIPPIVIDGIVTAIIDRSELTGDEEKN